MIRIVNALEKGKLAQAVTQALQSRGIPVRYQLSSGAEVIRAIKEMGGGVVIAPFKLRDMTACDLADALDDTALILVLAKGSALSLLDNDNLFKLPLPLRTSELVGAIGMLLQMDAMRAARTIPLRSKDAQTIIAQAKEALMTKQKLTEPEAHRLLQTYSMQHSIRMEEAAQAILQKLTH